MNLSKFNGLAFRCRMCKGLTAVDSEIGCDRDCGGINTNFKAFELDPMLSEDVGDYCVRCGRYLGLLIYVKDRIKVCDMCIKKYSKNR